MKNLINSIYVQVRIEMDPINLEGNTVHWVFRKENREYPDAIVAGCEKDIGITIMSKGGREISCLNRKAFVNDHGIEEYELEYEYMLTAIRSGYYSVDDKRKALTRYNGIGGSSMPPCAFIGS